MSAIGLGSRAILGEIFLRLEQGAIGWVNLLSFFVASDQASETHKWLGMTPQMRAWIGGRLVHGLREQGITIVNEDYEATLAVMLDEIRRDKTQQVMQRIATLADRANSHGAKLLSTLMINGESVACYDGQFFFDTDHSEGDSGTQSNDLSIDISALPVSQNGSTTAPSAEEAGQVVMQSIQAIYGFKDDQGEPMNEGAKEFIVMTPVPLWSAFLTGVRSPHLSSGQTNPINNLRDQEIKIEVVANPRLTWTTKVATFRADGGDGGAPFIRQEEVPLQVSHQAEGAPEEFHNRRHLYGVNCTGAMGFGFWQHACLATMA